MVDIYLDGLKPRIMAQWDKIGKKPKKKEIKLADVEEMEEELKEQENKFSSSQAKLEKAEKEKGGEKKEEGMEGKEEGKKEEGEVQKEQTQSENAESPKVEKKSDVRSLVNIIMSAHKDVEEGNIADAKNKYKKIMEMYKIVPQELKGEVFNECIILQKELKGK